MISPIAESLGSKLARDTEENERLFDVLQRRSGIDFRMCRRTVMARRLARRLVLEGERDLEQYLVRLEVDPERVDRLVDDLLINVTCFFRDPEAYARLRETHVPAVFDRAIGAVRVWVAGCATGEEAYSMAIVFMEEARRRKRVEDLRILATDIQPGVLTRARAGIYSCDAMEDIEEELVGRYFVPRSDGFAVSPQLREHLVFSEHSIVDAPPVTGVDFVSCRNVLIYFEREFQDRAVDGFLSALRPDGTLVLGPSESVRAACGKVDVLDQKWRIYRSKARPSEPWG